VSAQSNDKGVCKFAVTPLGPYGRSGASPDIVMTSGDACPTNKGSSKVAADSSLINTYSGSFRGKLTAECVMQSNAVDDR